MCLKRRSKVDPPPPPPSPPLWSSKILTKIFIEKNKKIFQTDKNDLNGKLGSDIHGPSVFNMNNPQFRNPSVFHTKLS